MSVTNGVWCLIFIISGNSPLIFVIEKYKFGKAVSQRVEDRKSCWWRFAGIDWSQDYRSWLTFKLWTADRCQFNNRTWSEIDSERFIPDLVLVFFGAHSPDRILPFKGSTFRLIYSLWLLNVPTCPPPLIHEILFSCEISSFIQSSWSTFLPLAQAQPVINLETFNANRPRVKNNLSALKWFTNKNKHSIFCLKSFPACSWNYLFRPESKVFDFYRLWHRITTLPIFLIAFFLELSLKLLPSLTRSPHLAAHFESTESRENCPSRTYMPRPKPIRDPNWKYFLCEISVKKIQKVFSF